MKLGIAGPISIDALKDHLHDGSTQINPYPRGLGGTPVVQLILALLERGQTLVVFTLDDFISREIILTGPNLKICIGPYRKQGRARNFFREERDYIKKAIQRESPDLVHAHWTYEFALGALESGFPTVVTAHDAPWQILRYMFSPYRLVRLVMAFNVARKASFLTAVSPYIAEHFKKYLFYKGTLKVIPNGLSDDVFKRESKADKKNGSITYATVLNGWGKLKNGSVVLKAFEQVRKNVPGSKLLMFGVDHGEGEMASQWAKQRGLDEGVEFIGSLDHEVLLDWLADQVDIVVHPALEESFSMSIAESMAMGISVIGGVNSGGVPYTLEEGKAGILVDMRSPERLTETMIHLALDDEGRRALGKAAHESAFRRFRISTVCKAYEETYGSMLSITTGSRL